MAKSQFVPAAQLKPLIGYFAVAFIVFLVVASLLPPGTMRTGLVAGWIVLFPAGGWIVFRRGRTG